MPTTSPNPGSPSQSPPIISPTTTMTSTVTTSTSQSGSSGLSPRAIGGIVGGFVALFLLLGGFIYLRTAYRAPASVVPNIPLTGMKRVRNEQTGAPLSSVY